MQVRPVHSGTATLKDATSEAIRDWVTNVETTHYILGSAAGPHPYPMLVRDFQAVIGRETRRQCQAAFGGKPDVLLACVGGGSNAIGLFHEVSCFSLVTITTLVCNVLFSRCCCCALLLSLWMDNTPQPTALHVWLCSSWTMRTCG